MTTVLVFYIQSMPVIVHSLHMPVAKCSLIHEDLTTSIIYIIKSGSTFAFGDTIKEARAHLDMLITGKTEQERIDNFCNHFNLNKKYTVKDFVKWHNLLTGSCYSGREQWLIKHNINKRKKYTLEEFLNAVEKDYNRELIAKVKKRKGL